MCLTGHSYPRLILSEALAPYPLQIERLPISSDHTGSESDDEDLTALWNSALRRNIK